VGEAADLVRDSYRRFNQADLDGWLETISPRVEWHDVPEIPGARTYHGRDEVRQFGKDLLELAERIEFSINELSERGDAVIADLYVDLVSRSGANLGWRAYTVFRINDGLIRYYHGYSDRAEALADFEGGT
jgi:ketosteroid isomerase-like protein